MFSQFCFESFLCLVLFQLQLALDHPMDWLHLFAIEVRLGVLQPIALKMDRIPIQLPKLILITSSCLFIIIFVRESAA